MKLPEPHRIVQGFGMEAEYLYTQEQMREALASHEAVMRMALEALMEAVSTCFSSQSHMQFMRSPEHFCKQAIKALEEQLK